MPKKLPRFRRVPIGLMQLEPRDGEIIRLVHRHRFLRSDQIIALLGGSRQQILRRLKLLFHHGYLERPRAQINYLLDAPRSLVYGLGRKGGGLLSREFGITVRSNAWSEKNHEIGRVYLEHTLAVADVLIALDLSCRKWDGVQLRYEDELPIATERQPFQWRVKIHNGGRLGVIPDHVFALDYVDAADQPQRQYFFLEADRGTMPVMRKDFVQSSFYRKMLTYVITWEQDIHKRELGIHRFRVLTVTNSAMRVATMVEACARLKRGQGLFLFADTSLLANDLLSALWQTGRPGETGSLLNQENQLAGRATATVQTR